MTYEHLGLPDQQGTLWKVGKVGRRAAAPGRKQNFETAICRGIERELAAALAAGHVVWFSRINAGAAYTGRRVRVQAGNVIAENGEQLELRRQEIVVRPRWIRLAPTGSPDFVVCLRGGRWLGLEAKGPGALRSVEQDVLMKQCERADAAYWIVRDPSGIALLLRQVVEAFEVAGTLARGRGPDGEGK